MWRFLGNLRMDGTLVGDSLEVVFDYGRTHLPQRI